MERNVPGRENRLLQRLEVSQSTTCIRTEISLVQLRPEVQSGVSSVR